MDRSCDEKHKMGVKKCMKNEEIERKFLVEEKNLPDLSRQVYMDIVQGYPVGSGVSSLVYRLRQVLHMSPTNSYLGEQYFQTIKGKEYKKRPEYETELLIQQFKLLWPLCDKIVLNKKRYVLPLPGYDHLKMHLDIYKNRLKGLYSIEVEFENEADCDAFNPPEWFGREVTEEKEYANLFLALYGLPEDFQTIYDKKPDEYFDFVNGLIEKYSCVSWGGKNCQFMTEPGSTKEDVAVFEHGVKGPADWFLFKSGLFEHRGYTGYKEKYNFQQFEEMVQKVEKNNQKWENDKSK
jgi:CYTH domain-containing protein